MSEEDYSKYYIQGSDHYLIPKDVFKELFNEINNWKEENAQLKEQRSKAIEYCDEKLKWNRDDGNDYWAGKNNAEQQVSSDIKDILESNKED